MEEKIFCGSGKVKTFEWGSLLNASINIGVLSKFANEKGYANVVIKKRREPDKYGNTHYICVDTYKKKEYVPTDEGQNNYIDGTPTHGKPIESKEHTGREDYDAMSADYGTPKWQPPAQEKKAEVNPTPVPVSEMPVPDDEIPF